MSQDALRVVLLVPIFLFSLCVHEFSHALIAVRRGDETPRLAGRLSMHPMAHADILGTLLLPIFCIYFNVPFFGWAKPVPINPSHLRNPRRDVIWVTLAGPLANLAMAIFWTGILKLTAVFAVTNSVLAVFLLLMARAGMIINLLLFFFNLLPIPPMDGSKVLASALSPQNALRYLALEKYGFFIILLLLLSGILAWILNPLMNSAFHLLTAIFQL